MNGRTVLPINKRTLFLATIFVGVAAMALAQTPDFSGNWELDEAASQITTIDGLAGFNDHAPRRLYINQTRDGKLIMSTRAPGAQPRNYLFGGETWLPSPDDPGQKMMMASRVRGLSLISTGHTRVAGETISIQEVLSINANGRSLSLRVTTSRNGEAEVNVLVYQRAR